MKGFRLPKAPNRKIRQQVRRYNNALQICSIGKAFEDTYSLRRVHQKNAILQTWPKYKAITNFEKGREWFWEEQKATPKHGGAHSTETLIAQWVLKE
jgi:hypothetical protein